MSEMMTIKEARKILGDKYAGITDEEIERIVEDLTVIARLTIKDLIQKREKSITDNAE